MSTDYISHEGKTLHLVYLFRRKQVEYPIRTFPESTVTLPRRQLKRDGYYTLWRFRDNTCAITRRRRPHYDRTFVSEPWEAKSAAHRLGLEVVLKELLA